MEQNFLKELEAILERIENRIHLLNVRRRVIEMLNLEIGND